MILAVKKNLNICESLYLNAEVFHEQYCEILARIPQSCLLVVSNRKR